MIDVIRLRVVSVVVRVMMLVLGDVFVLGS